MLWFNKGGECPLSVCSHGTGAQTMWFPQHGVKELLCFIVFRKQCPPLHSHLNHSQQLCHCILTPPHAPASITWVTGWCCNKPPPKTQYFLSEKSEHRPFLFQSNTGNRISSKHLQHPSILLGGEQRSQSIATTLTTCP